MAERIKVFVRIRPSVYDHKHNSTDSSDYCFTCFKYNTESNQFTLKQKIYTIDAILPPPTQQMDAYHQIATCEINAFLQGFNATIFAYGQTGSGKTHTIFGPDTIHINQDLSTSKKINSDPNISNDIPNITSLFGIVPRSLITVFEKLRSANHIKKHQMGLSCVEVYNTTLRDLLQPSNSTNLKIREDIRSKKFFVEKLTEEIIQTSEELMLFIKRIQSNREISPTNMNQTSSRSHILLQLRVIQQLLSGETKESLLTFVDLAGSEMVSKTGTVGDRLKEAGYINSSLSTLSRVIESLGMQHSGKKRKNIKHIPFRDSNLTKLLKTALGGNCKTTLVVCVSPDKRHKEETYSTLRFATRAACIKNEPVINKALDAQVLYDENMKLKLEIERLKTINNGKSHKLFQEKLSELECKEQEITDLKVIIDELQLELDNNSFQINIRSPSEIEDKNIQLTQTINELEIALMRERHLKQDYESKLLDLQVVYSEIASQKLFDGNISETEIKPCPGCDLVDVPSEKNMTKKVILDVIKFRQSIQTALSPNSNKAFRDMFIKYMPIDIMDKDNFDVNNINPTHLMQVCKGMNDEIQMLETELQRQIDQINNTKSDSDVVDIAFIDESASESIEPKPESIEVIEPKPESIEPKPESIEPKPESIEPKPIKRSTINDGHVLNEEDVEIVVEVVAEVVVDQAPVADTGCLSILKLFKCS